MKFAHFADCHIGAFRDQKLRDLNLKAFEKAIDEIIEKNVDFLLLAGDLFNTGLPAIDSLKRVVSKLRLLREKNIPVYIIAGSHDFSASGKTMIDVLEEAELVINVVKGFVIDGKLNLSFVVDKKTGAKITGIIGRKGQLDKKYYDDLNRDPLEKETGFKIFMFHTTITDFKTDEFKHVDSMPATTLPKNFNYYAGGHLHQRIEREFSGAPAIYPGPIFPESFRELEQLRNGSYVLYEDGGASFVPVNIINVHSIKLECNDKNPLQIQDQIKSEVKNMEFLNTILTIRLFGTLSSGKPTDINWRELYEIFNKKQAYFVMKNTDKLISREFSDIKVESKSQEEVEEALIAEQIGKSEFSKEEETQLIKKLMASLDVEKNEGEKTYDFEKRILESLKDVI